MYLPKSWNNFSFVTLINTSRNKQLGQPWMADLLDITVFLPKIQQLQLFGTPRRKQSNNLQYLARGFPKISNFNLYSTYFWQFACMCKFLLERERERERQQLIRQAPNHPSIGTRQLFSYNIVEWRTKGISSFSLAITAYGCAMLPNSPKTFSGKAMKSIAVDFTIRSRLHNSQSASQ